MKKHIKALLLIFIFTFSSQLFSQELYWAEKEVISSGISFFSSFKAGKEYIYSAWQEVSYFPDNSGGISNLIIQKSSDGYVWENVPHTIPGVEFYGVAPINNYSIELTDDDELLIAYSKGDIGAYDVISIYKENEQGEISIQSEINFNKAVLNPRIYNRGNDLGYILFTSQLKDLTTEIGADNTVIEIESGALSIFYNTSIDGTDWSQNREFIESTSDQSYLPEYIRFNEREYVVYQSIISSADQNNNFQLFIKSKRIDESEWGIDTLLTGGDEFVTGVGSVSYTEFDNQRASFVVRDNELGLTWERSYGYEAAKIYFASLVERESNSELVSIEKITTGSRSCSRPRGFEFNGEFYLIWFDNQLGSNDIVMAIPDKLSGLWIENIVSEDRNYFSVFGDFVLFKQSLRIFWEDQTIDRLSYNNTRSRIQVLNPDRDVDSPLIISDYKVRDNKRVVRFQWTKPDDSSGIKGYTYSWSTIDGELIYEKRVLSNVKESDFLQTELDGEYLFSIIAEDNAGNISEARKYIYTLDITPPDQVYFPELRTDEKGFLKSNEETIIWDSFDDDVVGFSHSLTYLGIEFDTHNFNIEETRISNNFNSLKSYSFNNIDNGFYALTVRAIDSAGNIGRPEAVIFKLNKYLPVTYISYVNYTQNTNGELVTTIHGRGFKAGGDVTTVILDRDGIEPYDYEFFENPDVFRVVTDRRIEGPNLDDIEGGTYRVGIIHPVRGKVFTGPIIKVESTGTIKFGDFTKGYEEVWQVVKQKRFTVSIEMIIFIVSLIAALIIFLFSLFRLIEISKESKNLYHDAEALVKGSLFLKEKDIIRIRDMQKHGLGLRVKFTALIIALVVAVIALISLPLASFMVDTQKKNLTEGLVQQTEILLNSISTGAKDYIQRKEVLELDNLVKTSEAMEDVIWASIEGVSESDSTVTNALWAYTDEASVGYYIDLPDQITVEDFNEVVEPEISEDDKEILLKNYSIEGENYILNSERDFNIDLDGRRIITDSGYPREVILGNTPFSDESFNDVEILIKSIEEMGAAELKDKKEQLVDLNSDIRNATGARRSELQDIILTLNNQISDALKKMSQETGELPLVDYQKINENDSYLFYKPILYEETGVDTYYKGMVKIRVSTERIIDEINTSRRNLIIRVGITAIAAILIGIIGALFLSTFMINPIQRLVAGVQVIRDTDDKAELKNHMIEVNSRDELYELASTVNQMTDGLVKAAATAKDVTMGKEIQKMFIPLEQNPSGEGKLTTGEFENDQISVFGYYEGAKGVSGDYFDFKQLDDEHFAMIKCDIAGKGIPASLIMVEVATIFLGYFRNWDRRRQGYKIDELVYSMNDLLEERGFKGRFAALIVVIMNTRTGKCYMCNAGDNLVHIYRHRKKAMETMVLHEVPAAGIFSSDMLEMQGGYKVETTVLDRNDILFLFTDGVEESKHLFRDENYNEIICEHPGLKEGEMHDTHAFHEEFEELGVERIDNILHSVIHKTEYSLFKYHYPDPEAKFTFDFSSLTGDVREAVLGLIAVEKVFRLNPDPTATGENVVKIDKVVNQFLLKHFNQYSDYYRFKVEKDESEQHDYFSHIKEDDQYDDLTILAIKKK